MLAISVDGLTPLAFEALGPDRVPAFTRLFTEGASTMDARTEVELTVTLPNHTGMLTGRRVDPTRAATASPGTSGRRRHRARRRRRGVASVFDVVHDAGGTSALFAGKEKFELL